MIGQVKVYVRVVLLRGGAVISDVNLTTIIGQRHVQLVLGSSFVKFLMIHFYAITIFSFSFNCHHPHDSLTPKFGK